MAQINREIAKMRMKRVETIFIPTEASNSFVSSTAVRELIKFGGPIYSMVPNPIIERLELWSKIK